MAEGVSQRVDDAITILFGGVRRIYWVGRPITPDSTCDRQMRLVNDIYSREAKTHPGMQYIDAYKVLSGSGGGYSQYLRDAHGEMQQVRDDDDEHLTYAGGARLAEVVMAAIKAEWLGKKKTSAGSAAPSPKASAKAAPAP